MDLEAPDELIRRIEAELRLEYAAEQAEATNAEVVLTPKRRRWPVLAAAAALVLLGAVVGQLLTIRTAPSDLAITVPNAADPGSAPEADASDGDSVVFGIQPAGAAPLDGLVLALLEADESVTAFRDAAQVVDGELGPGPYAVTREVTTATDPDTGSPTITELETTTSVMDGSARVRAFTDGVVTLETVVTDPSMFKEWARWPTDPSALLAQLVAANADATDADGAAAFQLLDAVRSPMASNEVRAAAWLALGLSESVSIESDETAGRVVLSIPVEADVLIAEAHADLRTGRIDRLDERWGSTHPEAGVVRASTSYPPPVLVGTPDA